MNVKPLNDWAVIIPSEASSKTAGGIYIPDTVKEKPAEGVVEAIGPGAFEEEDRKAGKGQAKKERKFIPTSVKPGSYVAYERYAGRKLTLAGREIVLVREKNILGILPAAPSAAREELPPLQLPHMTLSSGVTALTKRGSTALATAPEKRRTSAVPAAPGKSGAKKAVKKAAKKAKQKNVKKVAPKPAGKKTATKKKSKKGK